MSSFPTTKSFVATDALAEHLALQYGLGNVRCQLITTTLRDVYLVTTPQSRFVFYLYRSGARSPEHIAAEWQFVAYLATHGVPVAPSVPTIDGRVVLTFHLPEGIRYGVLTPFVPGRHLRQQATAPVVKTFGRHIATIHTLADALPEPLDRPTNDLATIIDEATTAARMALIDRPDAVALLEKCAIRLHALGAVLTSTPPAYGLIHGDVIRANALVDQEGTVTVLDFDLCGLGWRGYDIASYLLTIRGSPDEAAFAEAFLTGYTELRSLSSYDYETLPLFEATRAMFEIGTPAQHVNHWGSAYLYSWLDHSLTQLRRCMGQLGEAPHPVIP